MRGRRLARGVGTLALGLGVWLGGGLEGGFVPSARAQTTAAATATDPAYAAGYHAAYPLGEHDHAQGIAANAHKFRLYQQGSSGYRESYGSREAYRGAYQSGFSDGYSDGYAARPAAIALGGSGTVTAAATGPTAGSPAALPAPSPAAPAGAAPESDAVRIARGNGYREGYSVGQAAANRGAAYSANTGAEYQEARVGYQASLGTLDQYQLNFRSGFSNGYSDGFYHRLYNSQIGARPNPAHPLPTGQERQTARPSGVYANGLLIAQGTRIQGTLNQAIGTKTSQAGDRFTLTTSVPVWVGSVVAIPAGSTIQGTVEQVQRGGLFGGSAQIQLQYTTLTLPGQTPVALYASTAGVGANANVNQQEGTVNGQGADTGKRAAEGAGVGAVLGGIFGGGGGLLRGGAAGAAVGTAGAVLTHQRDLELRQGEPVSVVLNRPLELPPMNQGSSVSAPAN